MSKTAERVIELLTYIHVVGYCILLILVFILSGCAPAVYECKKPERFIKFDRCIIEYEEGRCAYVNIKLNGKDCFSWPVLEYAEGENIVRLNGQKYEIGSDCFYEANNYTTCRPVKGEK